MVRRQLDAQFLVAVGSGVVAVDRVQPVAAMLSRSGEVLDVVAWPDLVPPPETAEWPGRRVASDGGRVLVQDLPDRDPVAVSFGPDQGIRVSLLTEVPEVAWGYPRVFGGPWGKRGRWTFTSQRDGHRWTSQVSLEGAWDAGSGSIVAKALFEGAGDDGGDTAVVAIRRADARPWVFAPPHDLVVLDGSTGTPEPRPVLPIDISDVSWPFPNRGLSRRLVGYLPFTIAQAEVVGDRGGLDVRIGISGLDGRPVVELEFGLDARPGVRFVRRDEPIDELGRVAGLAFWNVLLEEDRFDLLIDAPLEIDGRVHV